MLSHFSSSLKSFHVTLWNPRSKEKKLKVAASRRRQREAWSRVQTVVAHANPRAPFQASIHSEAFNSLHTAADTSGGVSKAFLVKWLHKLAVGSNVEWGAENPQASSHPLPNQHSLVLLCHWNKLRFCCSAERVKRREAKNVLPGRMTAQKATSIR